MRAPHRGRRDASESPPRASIPARLDAVIGDRRGSILTLATVAMLSGFVEAALLAILAETAVTLATGASRAHAHIGPLHLHMSVDTLFVVAFVMVIVRLVLQVPLLTLPPRISADTQARMRTSLFHAFSRASWEVQSRDREGQLQETMTNQVAQATGALLNTMGLLTSSLNLIALLASAIALNALAAPVVFVISACLFALLRPLRGFGQRRARALSRAQVQYSRGIAESIRVAEETQVFGA